MTPEQELAQANAIASMYPATVMGAGGAVINGKEYLWDYDRKTMVLKPKRKGRKA